MKPLIISYKKGKSLTDTLVESNSKAIICGNHTKLHEESVQACHAPTLSRSKDIFPSLMSISVTLMSKVTFVGLSLHQPAALRRHVVIVAR